MQQHHSYLAHGGEINAYFPCTYPQRYTSKFLIGPRLFHVTFLTTGMTDSQHLTSPSFLSHTGNGLHVSAGPTIILVVIHSRAGTGNRPECCGVIKGLSLASVNSLTLCWRRAYAELMGLRRREEMGGWEGKPGS